MCTMSWFETALKVISSNIWVMFVVCHPNLIILVVRLQTRAIRTSNLFEGKIHHGRHGDGITNPDQRNGYGNITATPNT